MKLSRLVLALAVLAASASAEDWPTFMHDNQRTGVTAERLRPPLVLRWVYQSPSPPAKGWAQPVNGYGARKNKPNVSYDDAYRTIAVEGVCYFASSGENQVFAIDAATGRLRWSVFTDAAPRLAPAWSDGKLYIGADDGIFQCLDAATGRHLWELDATPRRDLVLGQGRFSSVWPIRAGGIVEDGIAYFTAGLFPSHPVYMMAVRASDGTVLWSRQVDAEAPQGYILSAGDTLFTTSRTAPARWSRRDGSPLPFATPAPDVPKAHEYRFLNGGTTAQVWNGRHIVYGRACILAYDPDQEWKDRYGKPRKGKLIFNWFNARQAVFHGDMAYLATDYHVVAARQGLLPDLAANECKEFEQAYKNDRVASYLDHLEDYDRAVRQHGEDSPQAQRLRDGPLKWGRERWEQWPSVSRAIFEKFARRCAWMTPLTATESLILAGDVLYAGGEHAVHAVSATAGEKLWSFRTGSRVRGLSVSGGRLFVSSVDGAVRCFEKGRDSGEPVRVASAEHAKPGAADPVLAGTVKRVVEQAAIRQGYALVVGVRHTSLAVELAGATDLTIELIDAAGVADARSRLASARLHGHRVSARQSPLDRLPYPPYLFDLVVAPDAPAHLEELFRVTRPCGGVLLAAGSAPPVQGAAVERVGTLLKLTRGPLPASRDWTHNYASPANTYCSEDPTVRGPFGILWYGEPGPRKRIERHATPPVPLVVGGTFFTIGYDRVMAYDVYNGTCRWEREIQGATRQGLPIDTSNLAADARSLFVVVNDAECLRLDARTGKTVRTYSPPKGSWAWIAREGGLLYGSSRTGDRYQRKQTSDGVFAMDAATGTLAWRHKGQSIDHDGIAIADGRLFLVDRGMTDVQRQEALATTVRDTSAPDRRAVDRKGQPIPPDLRKIVALDAVSGKTLWEKPWNVTDITLDDMVVQEKVGVACMSRDGVLVVHGTGSLGHPHKEFLAGKFARRALYAFDAATGRFLWGGRKGYRKRPIIVGDHVYAEPFAWHLRTGALKTVPNPLSGLPQAMDFHRGYIGCGHLLASAAALFGARGGIAYWNLDEATGFTPFAGMALACGLGAAPANGVLAVPEGRSGCTCDTPIYTSIVLYPRPDAEAWATGFSGGRAETLSLPVRHVSVNLGARGYRQDDEGNLWIPYPAGVDSGPVGEWFPAYQHDERMCYRLDGLRAPIADTSIPWVYTSGYAHDKPLVFCMQQDGAEPAKYTVILHFAEPEALGRGQRVFSVALQGKTVLRDLDVAGAAGGHHRALVREFRGIEVRDNLEVRLVPSTRASSVKPILAGLQAVREEP